MTREAEYSLPQQPINGMLPVIEDDQRRVQTEAYASSAIYTELNYGVTLLLN